MPSFNQIESTQSFGGTAASNTSGNSSHSSIAARRFCSTSSISSCEHPVASLGRLELRVFDTVGHVTISFYQTNARATCLCPLSVPLYGANVLGFSQAGMKGLFKACCSSVVCRSAASGVTLPRES